jgi:hypothetical protein
MYREYPSHIDEAFMVAVKGSYYGDLIQKVYEENRVCKVPYEENLPLYTAWDF